MLEREIVLLDSLRRKKEQLELQIQIAQDSVLKEMDNADLTSCEVMVGGNFIRATVVQPTRIKHDEEKMQAMLEPEVWELVSTRHIDNIKLEAGLRNHLLEPTIVEVCSTVQDTKRYVRLSS